MKRFVVMLPTAFDSTRRYPVLYLLHGWGGGSLDWSTKTRLHAYATTAQILVVMPRAENSWYVNSATNATIRYEDYIVQDLPKHVITRFPVADASRQAIAGLSMGGYGALLLGARLGPARTAAICAVSPALWLSPEAAAPGAFDSTEDFAANTVFGLPALGSIPLRVDCGTDDPFYAATKEFVAQLPNPPAGGFSPGGHDADYWSSQLPGEIAWLAKHLSV
jgi:S-formylglutathione hydrolase FrmB